MDKRKLNHMISVDSETGDYWDGQRALKTQAQINSVIKPVSAGWLRGNFRIARFRALIQLLVVKIVLMIVVYFEVDSLGLM
jgi:hypothetical protein